MIQQIAPLMASPNAYTPLALTWCEKALEKETALFLPVYVWNRYMASFQNTPSK